MFVRGGKQGNQRHDRYAQMTQQESVIERKKKEIQDRIEAQKRKETEEALKKVESPTTISKLQRRNPVWKRDEKRVEQTVVPEALPSSVSNVFSNDGSFLDQFKKLSNSGLKPDNVDVKTIAKVRQLEEEEKERKIRVEKEKEEREKERKLEIQRREKERQERHRLRDLAEKEILERESKSYELSQTCQSTKLVDSNIQLQLPPPGVVQLVPQHPVQLLTSQIVLTNTQPVSLVPITQQTPNNSVQLIQPTTNVQFTTLTQQPVQATLITPVTNYQLSIPVQQVMTSHGHIIQETNTIQNSVNYPHYCPIPQQQQQLEQTLTSECQSVDDIPRPLPMSPQTIPTPLPIQVQNIPPPSNNQIKIGHISSPDNKIEKERRKRKKSVEQTVSGCSLPPPGYHDEIPLPQTSTASGVSHDETMDQVARMVAKQGDNVEEVLTITNEDDPAFRFLFDKTSVQYRHYRQLVTIYKEQEETSLSNNNNDGDGDDNYYNPSSDSGQSSSGSTRKRKQRKGRENMKTDEEETGYTADNDVGRDNNVSDDSADENDDGPKFAGFGYKSRLKEATANTPAQESPLPRKKRKSRWGDTGGGGVDNTTVTNTPVIGDGGLVARNIPMPGVVAPVALGETVQLPSNVLPISTGHQVNRNPMLSLVTRTDPGLLNYARQAFGTVNLSEEDWKKAEDHYKINLLYQDLLKKRAELDRLQQQGKYKYQYDSDEETEGGTWEHKLRQQEMQATELWAEELTKQAAGKHHIGDFLPPDELKRFLEKYNAVKEGREPDLSDYKEFKLKEDNVGYQLLQKMGWSEGQGLGQDGTGITAPVNKANSRFDNHGLGVDRPDGVSAADDEYDAYRKRMMLAYRFRPNPLNNPRRPYY